MGNQLLIHLHGVDNDPITDLDRIDGRIAALYLFFDKL
jgi:hypothetical protein